MAHSNGFFKRELFAKVQTWHRKPQGKCNTMGLPTPGVVTNPELEG